MLSVRKLYVLSITAVIIASFSSFFSNEVKAMLFVLAIVMDMFENKGAPQSRPLRLLLIFYLISFFYVFGLGRGHFSEIRNILLPYPMMLMCFWIAPGLTRLSVKEARFIWYAFLVVLVENLVATAVIVQFDPRAVREIFEGEESNISEKIAQAYSRSGLLTYQSAHILALMCALLVSITYEEHVFWKKTVAFVIAVAGVLVMYITTITTALLLGLLSIVAIAFFYFNKGDVKKTLASFTVLIALLLVTGGLASLLFSSSRGENNEIAEKFNDLGESILSGKGQGQVAGREAEYQLTWGAIARNPLLGGASGPDDTGQHALFLDYWAYYGVFCLFLFVGWWKEVKRMKRCLSRKRWYAHLICLLPIVFLCFLKGPFFLPLYILATIVILRVGFKTMEPDVA